jgi:hypothetical protein
MIRVAKSTSKRSASLCSEGTRIYDTSADNIVRVNVYDFRKRLEAYFAAEGQAERTILDIPKGGYSAAFTPRVPEYPAFPARGPIAASSKLDSCRASGTLDLPGNCLRAADFSEFPINHKSNGAHAASLFTEILVEDVCRTSFDRRGSRGFEFKSATGCRPKRIARR